VFVLKQVEASVKTSIAGLAKEFINMKNLALMLQKKAIAM